jgi:hypothetical protein
MSGRRAASHPAGIAIVMAISRARSALRARSVLTSTDLVDEHVDFHLGHLLLVNLAGEFTDSAPQSVLARRKPSDGPRVLPDRVAIGTLGETEPR